MFIASCLCEIRKEILDKSKQTNIIDHNSRVLREKIKAS